MTPTHTHAQEGGTGTQRFRERNPPPQGHTAGKRQSQADPTATEIPPDTLLLEDFLDGEMGWLWGLSKSCTPILNGLAQWFPVWVSQGVPQRLSGGPHAV